LTTMSIFTYHLFQLPLVQALIRTFCPLKIKNANGLIHSEIMSVMELGAPILSVSRFFSKTFVFFAQWETEEHFNVFQEKLGIVRNADQAGLFHSFDSLGLKEHDHKKVSEQIIEFYLHTSQFKINLDIKWNPFFRIFGYFINKLFSQRLNQLNIPIVCAAEEITSEIIFLNNLTTGEVVHTIWLRKMVSTGKIVYCGFYTTCQLPSGQTCIKAVFPLPRGSATVILEPSIGADREFVLNARGKKFGEAGFYFLLRNNKNELWSRHIPSFTDKLLLYEEENYLKAVQSLKLWNMSVARLEYEIQRKMQN
jgi:hypothetical protein